MTRRSAVDLLALHAARVVGFGEPPAPAARFVLDPVEVDDAGGRDAVSAVHQRFLPLKGRLQAACTDELSG